MANTRDSINNIINYIKNLGIEINIGKNKARGNKGLFKAARNSYRIDISKDINDTEILKILCHEFAHYIHFCADKKLSSLDFVFGNLNGNIVEQLIKLTVSNIPKKNVEPLFETKKLLVEDITSLTKSLKKTYKNQSEMDLKFKNYKSIIYSPINYFFKYDRFKYNNKIYSLDNICSDFPNIEKDFLDYINLLSKKRAVNRINSKISRLNRYYNSNSELFANSLELFITNKAKVMSIAPDIYNYYQHFIECRLNPALNDFIALVEKSCL